MLYHGNCHCGAITFEVDAPEHLEVERCNCSICSKFGFLHLIVPKSKFKLLSGNELLETYTFNTGTAKHHFCRTCGVKAFYIPRSNPDGIDVNVNCLEPLPQSLTVIDFDGQNWEANAESLAHKSKE